MDDAIKAELRPYFQVLPEKAGLFLFVVFIVCRESFLLTGQPVVVQAGLAECDNSRMNRQAAKV